MTITTTTGDEDPIVTMMVIDGQLISSVAIKCQFDKSDEQKVRTEAEVRSGQRRGWNGGNGVTDTSAVN